MIREYTKMTVIILIWLVIGNFNMQVYGAPMNETQPPQTTPRTFERTVFSTTQRMTTKDDVVKSVSSTPKTETLKDFEKKVDELSGSITKMLLPYVVQNADARISTPCIRSLMRIFTDARRMKITTMKLLDSMAKPGSGMLEGSFASMGDYEECLSVSVSKRREPSNNPDDELFHGMYCTIGARLPQALTDAIIGYADGHLNASQLGKFNSLIENMPLKNFAKQFFEYNIGLCVPSTCTIEDIKTFIALADIPFPAEVKRCESKNSRIITYDQIVILALFGFLGLLVVTGTAIDGILYLTDDTYEGYHKGKVIHFLLAFSVYNNTKKFMTIKKDTPREVTCINGMYITGTFLVIVYHSYFVPFLSYAYRHASNIDVYFQDFAFTLIATMSISIEAYFLFSGFFLVYSKWTRAKGSEVKISIPRLMLRRYLRLTPSMLFVIGILLILPVFGNGPIWHDIFDLASDNTRRLWWTYVVMINNFLLPKDQSFLYLWFIPCLMQITIVGIFLAWILSKKPKLGITAIVLTAVACNVGLGIMTYQKDYPPSYAIYFLAEREISEVPIYTAPLSHVSSFCIGMILGYYMSHNREVSFRPITVFFGWILCLGLTVGTQLVLYMYHDGKRSDPLFSAIYAATHRTAFSLGMVWVILACAHGYGGVMGKLMCWRGFAPLSKLGYSGYLVHYLILAYHISSVRTPMMYTHLEIWIRIAGYNAFTFLFAYLMHITFEMPLNYFESKCFERKNEPKMNGNTSNGVERMVEKEKISDVSSPVAVQPVWTMNGVYRENHSENSKL